MTNSQTRITLPMRAATAPLYLPGCAVATYSGTSRFRPPQRLRSSQWSKTHGATVLACNYPGASALGVPCEVVA